jgi:plastocyanin
MTATTGSLAIADAMASRVPELAQQKPGTSVAISDRRRICLMRRYVRYLHALAPGLLLCAALSTVACGDDGPTSPSNPAPPPSGSGDGTAGNPITMFVTNSVFSPNPLTVRVGQYVNFKNNDTIEHSATFDNGSYESGNIPPLSAHSAPVAMSSAGSFGLRCRLHGERSTIVVTQ